MIKICLIQCENKHIRRINKNLRNKFTNVLNKMSVSTLGDYDDVAFLWSIVLLISLFYMIIVESGQ